MPPSSAGSPPTQTHVSPRHYLGPLRQLRIKGGELLVNFFKIFDGVAPFTARNIDDVHQQPASFHMPQKLMAKAHAFARPFDQARNIRHHKGLALAHANHAQHRGKRGKMIIRDNRLCLAHHGNQR